MGRGGDCVVSVGVVNVNSLTNKVLYVQNFLSSHNLWFLGICETWLLESCPSSFVMVPGFSFFRKDVKGSVRKHGVGLYVKQGLDVRPVEVDAQNVLVVYVVGWEVYSVVVYRPPSYTSEENNMLTGFLYDFCCSKSVLLLGDFNLPSIRWNLEDPRVQYLSPTDRMFYDVFRVLGLKQYICEATFFPSGNILDLVLASDPEFVVDSSICEPFPHCHHCPLVVGVAVSGGDVSGETRLFRSWRRGDYDNINNELFLVDWVSEFEGLSVQNCYDLLTHVFNSLVDLYVPLSSRAASSREWLHPPPRHLARRRAAAWKRYKTLRAQLDRSEVSVLAALDEFLVSNQEYRGYARNKQWEYEQGIVRRLSESPKLFHSYIRRKKKGRLPIGPLTV